MNGCAHTRIPVMNTCNFSKIQNGRLRKVICAEISEMAGEMLTDTQLVTRILGTALFRSRMKPSKRWHC